MGQFDLRGFNVNTDEDAVEFLELVAKKLPQVLKRFKEHSLERQSLISSLNQAQSQANKVENSLPTDGTPDYSVAQRLAGKSSGPQQSAPVPEVSETDRLAQLRAAQTVVHTDNAGRAIPQDPNTIVAPGELGLAGAGVMAATEEETGHTPEAEGGQEVPASDEPEGNPGLAPSDVPSDDGVQQEDEDKVNKPEVVNEATEVDLANLENIDLTQIDSATGPTSDLQEPQV